MTSHCCRRIWRFSDRDFYFDRHCFFDIAFVDLLDKSALTKYQQAGWDVPIILAD
jgi:hypothetical protein